jgi:hypothetical protein
VNPPSVHIVLELEAVPRLHVVCSTAEEELALLAWLESRPRGVTDLLARIVDEPAGLFPWLAERAA